MSGLSCSRKVPGDTGRRNRSEGAAAGAAELPENLRARQSCPYTAACGKRRALGWDTALCQTPQVQPRGCSGDGSCPFWGALAIHPCRFSLPDEHRELRSGLGSSSSLMCWERGAFPAASTLLDAAPS